MLKKLAVLIIFLLPVIAAQAFSVTLSSIDTIKSILGTCASGDLLMMDVSASFAGTIDDGGDFDRFTHVLYDGNGTALSLFNSSFNVGFSSGVSGLGLPLLATPQSRPFTLNFYDTTSIQTAAGAANYPLIESFTFDPADYGVCSSLPLAGTGTSGDEEVAPHFTDGRLNNFDMAAPFVVYGHDYEDGRGLVVYSPTGDLLLTVTAEELGECTGETVLLASANGVSLYQLDTCEYQMMAASLDGTKTYVLIFNGLNADSGYSSHEE